jgi:hypothetical protein
VFLIQSRPDATEQAAGNLSGSSRSCPSGDPSRDIATVQGKQSTGHSARVAGTMARRLLGPGRPARTRCMLMQARLASAIPEQERTMMHLAVLGIKAWIGGAIVGRATDFKARRRNQRWQVVTVDDRVKQALRRDSPKWTLQTLYSSHRRRVQ